MFLLSFDIDNLFQFWKVCITLMSEFRCFLRNNLNNLVIKTSLETLSLLLSAMFLVSILQLSQLSEIAQLSTT